MFDSKRRGDKTKGFIPSYKYDSAKAEIYVLEVIQEFPGLPISQIALKTKMTKDKVKLIVRAYHGDQLIWCQKIGRQSYWYLVEVLND